MTTGQNWTWSEPHQDYYLATIHTNGETTYMWAKQSGQQQQAQPVQPDLTQQVQQPIVANVAPQRPRGDSHHDVQQTIAGANEAVPAPSVPLEIRQQEVALERDFIAGTPQEGWYDKLDPSYRMRTGSEARDFFRRGRLFAMLYTEPAGEGARRGNNDAFTVIKYGEEVFSQIRRFVVVSVRKNFVHACAISTYRKQGTLKRGCDPGEHAVVYNTGIDPELCYLPGERERGLYKEPIEVSPADTGSYLTPESRIRFGHVYSIEWNVKVKDIGRVVAPALSTLIAHYDEENGKFEADATHHGQASAAYYGQTPAHYQAQAPNPYQAHTPSHYHGQAPDPYYGHAPSAYPGHPVYYQ